MSYENLLKYGLFHPATFQLLLANCKKIMNFSKDLETKKIMTWASNSFHYNMLPKKWSKPEARFFQFGRESPDQATEREELEQRNASRYLMTKQIPRNTPLPSDFNPLSAPRANVGYGSPRFLVKPPTCILAHLLLSGPLMPTRSTEWASLYTSPVWRVSSNRDFDTDLGGIPRCSYLRTVYLSLSWNSSSPRYQSHRYLHSGFAIYWAVQQVHSKIKGKFKRIDGFFLKHFHSFTIFLWEKFEFFF